MPLRDCNSSQMASLSPSDFGIWSQNLDDSLHMLGGVVVETWFYGVYMVLFVTSMNALLKGGKRSTGSIFQFTALCVLFAFTTGLWVMDIVDLVLYFNFTRLILSPSPTAAAQRQQSIIITDHILFASDFLFDATFILGDLLIAWRVLVLYRSQASARYIRIAFALLWCTMSALVAWETACWVPTMTASSDPPLCDLLRKVGWVTSLALNIFASLLLWRVVRQRRTELHIVGGIPGFGKTKVDRVLRILLISSALYILFGISAFALQFTVNGDKYRTYEYFITAAEHPAIGFYPTIVTIFVLNQDAIFGPLSCSPTQAMITTTASICFNDAIESQTLEQATVSKSGYSMTDSVIAYSDIYSGAVELGRREGSV